MSRTSRLRIDASGTQSSSSFGAIKSPAPCNGRDAANGLRVENTFKKEAWNTIVEQFNKRYHETYSLQVLKNHYQSQQSMFKTFMNLKTLTGAGWDEEKKMVTGTKEWFDQKIQANPKYKPWRTKGFPNFDLMLQLKDVDEDVKVPDADTCVLPAVPVSDGTVGLTDASIAPLAEQSGTPGVTPAVSRSSQPTTPSPSTPSKTTHAKISKEKFAAKESERKEAAQIRDKRQSKLDQMHINRNIELEKL
ncbi:hypothetical protein DFH28DRAFT_1187195 [Melampsora americana]|nr:hypothetical protein DFH28DRAFT_1187195 [Melampsora americana]